MGQAPRQARHGINTGRKPAPLITLTCTKGHTFLVHASALDLVGNCPEKTGLLKKCGAPIKRPT